MKQDVIDITPAMTVNEIVQKHPQTLAVFKQFGVDTCCGGALPLGTVLVKHKLEDARVLEALWEAAAAT
jgi:regulator of cell morphogenesis and NO signaling